MNVSLTDEIKDFVQRKIENGQYPSEEAVVEAALKRLRDQEVREAERPCRLLMNSSITSLWNTVPGEADDGVTLDEVLEATSTIKDSMARVIIEEERADRF